MALLKVGSKIINTDAIAYVDMDAKNGLGRKCVTVYLATSNGYFDNNYGRMEAEIMEFLLDTPEAQALTRWFSDGQNVTLLA